MPIAQVQNASPRGNSPSHKERSFAMARAYVNLLRCECADRGSSAPADLEAASDLADQYHPALATTNRHPARMVHLLR